jgi:colicin import membrane protein
MELILGVGAAVLAVLCIALFVRSMELTSSHNELRDQVASAQREARKLKEQLTSKASKLQAKSQEASKSGKSTRDQRARLGQLSEDLQQAKTESEKAKERVRELTGATDRLRIEREELRQDLARAQARKAPAAPAPVAVETAAPVADPAPAVAARIEPDAPRSPTAVERDLERAQEDLERLRGSHQNLKRRLVETTADLRLASRKNENNRRAYMITQLQLDLAQDEVYTLKHGRPPEMPRAEKSKKRASLTPKEETVEVNREAGLIELPDVDALEAESERLRLEERATREAEALAEAEALVEAEAKAQEEAEAQAEAEAKAQAKAQAKAKKAEASAAAKAEASAEAEEAEAAEKAKGPVRRRRAPAA